MKDGFKIVNPNAAGIDIASQMHYVAVPADRDVQAVRKFGSFTKDLHEIARWLKQCNIDTVAMESTGIYWIQLYLILEEYGFDVYLVNARHIKNVTGRKSDVLDCQWILQLHTYGLLSASFQPENLTRELRSYMRHRKNLTQSYASQVQLMQKAFEQMNIKLHNVITDITGKTGQNIIKSILAGERNPTILAQLTDIHVKKSKDEIIKSLQGNWRDENLFELKQSYELFLIFKEKINECDFQIQKVLEKIQNSSDLPKGSSNKIRGVYNKNRFNFNATNYLINILGTDVTQIFGISELLATEIISETGIDMSKWPSKKHFTSWLNLVPNNRVSGGKLLKPKKVKKKNKAGQAFLMAAYALQRSNHWLGEFYRRLKSRNGPVIATKATARKIALIFYDMVKQKSDFNPIPIDTYNQKFKERKLKYIKTQAHLLGLNLVPV
ncbi:MAG TPA: IS110 family transposase [Bacteroidales bacterium]|jgi:transposase|nr:IS110 family transposase [Bacteroidales bacterium]